MIKLYVIYDVVAEESGPIFQAKNDGIALRNYQTMLIQQKVNPQDYSLWYIGDYNSESMRVEPQKPEEVIVSVNMEDPEDE